MVDRNIEGFQHLINITKQKNSAFPSFFARLSALYYSYIDNKFLYVIMDL